jgi:hypothetical protein
MSNNAARGGAKLSVPDGRAGIGTPGTKVISRGGATRAAVAFLPVDWACAPQGVPGLGRTNGSGRARLLEPYR